MSLSSARKNWRKDHLSSELPQKLMTVLALAARGMTFEDAATEVHMSSNTLHKWRKHPDAQPYYGIVKIENFLPAKNSALRKSQRIMYILCEVAENPAKKHIQELMLQTKLQSKL